MGPAHPADVGAHLHASIIPTHWGFTSGQGSGRIR